MKPVWKSKMMWVNLVGLVFIVAEANGLIGADIGTPESQAVVLAAVNLILRAITKESISWT